MKFLNVALAALLSSSSALEISENENLVKQTETEVLKEHIKNDGHNEDCPRIDIRIYHFLVNGWWGDAWGDLELRWTLIDGYRYYPRYNPWDDCYGNPRKKGDCKVASGNG